MTEVIMKLNISKATKDNLKVLQQTSCRICHLRNLNEPECMIHCFQTIQELTSRIYGQWFHENLYIDTKI